MKYVSATVGGLLVTLLVAFSVTSATAATADARGSNAKSAAALAGLPNVVLILTDDQPKGTVDAMPTVRSELKNRGVDLKNGIIPTSLCCPSRSSLLTGDHSHTTGVYTNSSTNHGGWPAFQPRENLTLATQLDAVGYNTALIGKYVNGFSTNAPSGYIPPGWDQFIVFDPDNSAGDGAYYNYRLFGTVPTRHYGTRPTAYSTDVLGRYAKDFINSVPSDEPLFLYFAPHGPHGPITPADRDKNTWPLEPASALPGLNERDLSDKPAWVQDNPRVNALAARKMYTDQHETLMSVDDQVRVIMAALGPEETANTLFVFMSDNGFMLGVHRILGKDVPYRRSSEVPMYLRWDGHIAPKTTDQRVTTNIDVTATIAEAAGVSWPMDGKSYLSSGRAGTVLEQIEFSGHPAYCGYRNRNYLYVDYSAGAGEELYDYTVDPYELTNVASDPAYAATVAQLRARAVALCSPTPPGFSWN